MRETFADAGHATSYRLSLLAALLMLVLLFPFVFGEIVLTSLQKLHLSPEMAFQLMIGIIIGSVVKI